MKHPIYKNPQMNKSREIILKSVKDIGYDETAKNMAFLIGRESSIPAMEVLPTLHATLMKQLIEGKIQENGHVLMKGKLEDWASGTSERTISLMNLDGFKFPFNAGTVMFGDKQVDFYFGELVGRKALFVSHEVEDGVFVVEISANKNIGEEIDKIGMNDLNRKLVYAVLSYLLYIAMFNTKEKVISTLKPKNQGSKRKSIPKHKVNVISLNVPSKQGENVNSGESKKLQGKTWIVRGHWRNQWYAKEGVNKPIWMSPYWKGDGKEEVEKVYKF